MAYKKREEQNQPINWAETASDLYGQIANRPKFQYDVDQDALYQSYRDQYARNGQRAMTDTMGQAAALTGGYGSTYAQAVGQQQYNDYMTKLNAEIPNLYAQARTAYDKDTDDLYNRYNLAANMESQEYNRGRDALADQRYDQEQAQSYALMMIKSGLMPSSEALASTGWNLDDVKAMVNYYKQQNAMTGGSSGGGGRSYRSSGGDYNVDQGNQSAYNPLSGALAGAITGAGTFAAKQANNITDAQLDDAYHFAIANGKDALESFMYKNYGSAPNFDAAMQKLKQMLTSRKPNKGYSDKITPGY